MSYDLTLTVNGQEIRRSVAPLRLLIALLRDDLGLTGTHAGCDTAQCGACTVLVDGRAVKSCNVLALQVDRMQVTTIEGLANADGTLHPMQRAFGQHHALQCGYCTPGMITRAHRLLQENPDVRGVRATTIRLLGRHLWLTCWGAVRCVLEMGA